jgi:phenylalanyl-tRNA synthetase beta chain
MLNIFLGRVSLPDYKLAQPASGALETIVVKEDVRATPGVILVRAY